MLIEGYRRRYELAEAEADRRDQFATVSFRDKLRVEAALFGPYLPLHIAFVLLNRIVNKVSVIRLFGTLTTALHDLRLIRRFLITQQVSLLVFSEDNVEMRVPLWVRAARDLEVPSVVVPFTIANALEPYESYHNQPDYQLRARAINLIAGWLFPKWKADYKGRRFLRAHGDRIFALELLRSSPPNPWIMNSGSATAIAAESMAMVSYYRECGLPAEKLVLTGSVADDLIHAAWRRRDALREQLVCEFGLEPDWPLLVCAFPPNQLGSRPHPEFADYPALWRAHLQSLNKVRQWNIVIRLHPRTTLPEIDQAALGHAVICDWDTSVLVALCDLYVMPSHWLWD